MTTETTNCTRKCDGCVESKHYYGKDKPCTCNCHSRQEKAEAK